MSMCSKGAITWKREPGPYLSTRSMASRSAMPFFDDVHRLTVERMQQAVADEAGSVLLDIHGDLPGGGHQFPVARSTVSWVVLSPGMISTMGMR